MEFVYGLVFLCSIVGLYLHKKSSEKFQANEASLKKLKEEILSIDTKLQHMNRQVESLCQEKEKLWNELDETKKKLDFYANITEDSGNLTVDDDTAEREHLLDIAKAQISAKEKTDTSDEIDTTQKEAILDTEQQRACQYINETANNVFVTGKAGTGKSFLLDAFVATTQKSNVVLAPTGIAALNVKGATLHSTFGYYNLVNLSIDEISSRTIRLNSEKKLVLKNVSTIVIDEISMVRADTFDKIDRILRAINGDNDLLFGGKQIVVFGDLFQLPPIAKKSEYEYLVEKYGGVHFFLADAFKKGNFKFVELTINHRQNADQRFFEILNRVREGKTTVDDVNMLNKRVSTSQSVYDRYTTLFPTKSQAETVNLERLNALDTKEYVYHATVVIDKYPEKTKNLESIFPISEPLRLKVGALVMMVANDPDHRWVNGTMGIVERLTKDTIFVSINKHSFAVHPFLFKEQEAVYKNGRVSYEDVFGVYQYPLVLGYAMTIHKSQGQTYKNVVCDITDCFATGQAYVALSRCASLDGLHLQQKIVEDSIQVDRTVLDFYNSQNSSNVLVD